MALLVTRATFCHCHSPTSPAGGEEKHDSQHPSAPDEEQENPETTSEHPTNPGSKKKRKRNRKKHKNQES